MKTSLLPALVSGPPPRSTVYENAPVTSTLPLLSTATPLPDERKPGEPLPKVRDHTYLPSGAYLTMKMDCHPLLEVGPPPKSTVPPKFPVTSTLPLLSTATPRPSPCPTQRAHCRAPAAEYLATKRLTAGQATPPRSVGCS